LDGRLIAEAASLPNVQGSKHEGDDLPYTRDEIAEVGTFECDRLRAPWPGARQDMGEEADLQQNQPEEGGL
jgi:hypothetical protein